MRYGQPQIPGFTIIKQLGKGSYGTVYKVKRVSDGNSYALKMVDLTSMNQRQREEAVNEIRIMASITSPFIIGFHEATIQDHKLCIVTDYAKLGDLSNLIARRKLKRRLSGCPRLLNHRIISETFMKSGSFTALCRFDTSCHILCTVGHISKIVEMFLATVGKESLPRSNF